MVLKLIAICITVLILAILPLNVQCENEVPLKGEKFENDHSDHNKHHASQVPSLAAPISEEIPPSNENILDTGKTLQENIESSKTEEVPIELPSDSLNSVASEGPVEPTETVIDASVSESLVSSQSDVTLQTSQEQITQTDTLQTASLDASQNISSETLTNEATPVLQKDNSIISSDHIEPVTLNSNIVTDHGEAPSPTPISAPPEKSIDPTTGPDDLESGKQDEDFPSFAEWTLKVLAEQEKTKQESKTTTGKASQPSANQKKLRNNYASKACGAKVLAANPEAENIGHVLTTNKDEYMINPCSSKKWFVVELCEPVQVKLLELTSLELFSSQPKSFRVSISDRYPAKEWIPLGLYEASDVRSVQSFQALNDQFVKYVKVELIEHYGNEHFCPVTLFRLYGVPITDDDDNEENDNNSNTEADLAVTDEEESKDGARNLFMSAKDTVVNLVKKVLNVNKDNDKVDTNNTESGSELSLNISADGTILPCVPSITHNDINMVDLPTVLFPTPTIKDSSAESSADTSDPPIVTKLDDDEQLEAENLLTSSPDVKSCLNNNFTSPNILCSYIKTMLKFPMLSICQKADFVIVSTTVQSSLTPESSSEETLTSSEKHTEVTQSEIVPTQSEPGMEATMTHNDEESGRAPWNDFATDISGPVKEESTKSDEMDLTEPTDEKPTESVEESQLTQNIDTTSQIILEPSTSDISINNDQSEDSTEKLDVTATTSQNLGEQTQMESETTTELPTPERSQIQPDVISPTVSEVSTEIRSSSETVSASEKATPGIELPITDEVLPKDNSGGRAKDLELVKVPLGSIAKRETAIMRLTNRIKALELNVSLSSRFLEELSKKFKKQNEEMMKLMNKTIARLNVTTRESEIRDLHQQRRLDILEARMDNLTTLIDSLSQNMEALANKISDRQIVWSSIEFVMLMIVCVVCLIRGRNVNISPELKHLLETMPKQPNPNTNLRHNSISSIGYIPPTTNIRKNISMTALADQATCDNISSSVSTDHVNHLVKDGHKKKKKRKKSIGSKLTTYIHEKVDNDTSPVQISCEAGLLFGTDAGTSLSGVGLQEVDRGPHSQSSSSSTVSLPAQCHRRNFSDDIKVIETTSDKKPIAVPKPIQVRGQKNKKQSRNFVGGASDIKVETLKSFHGRSSKPKDEYVSSVTTTSILAEPRNKSRVSWLF